MKFVFRLIGLLILVVIIGAIAGVFLAFEDEPVLSAAGEITVDDVRRARSLIEASDPRDLAPGEITSITVTESDMELLLNYGLSRLRGGAAEVQFDDNRADVIMSIAVRENPLGGYINLQGSVSQWGDTLVIESLRIGGVAIPGAIADGVMRMAHDQLLSVPEYTAALEAVNGYSIAPGQATLIYQWQPELVDQLSSRGRELLVGSDLQERLLAHAENLSAVTNDSGLSNVTSAVNVLAPMLEFARARGGDAIEENRAAILVTSMYIMGISVPRLLGLPQDTVRRAGRHRLTLSGRADFAQHFLVSAGLTVSAGTGLADTIGLLKELDDSQGGSGFSFTDIGADRTGVRFAELATADTTTASALQEMLIANPSEAVFMANFLDLPEYIQESEFMARYGGVGAPAYNRVIEDIEGRIDATPLFTELADR